MTLSPAWRTRILGSAAAVIAVWLSIDIANGEFFRVTVVAMILGLLLLARFQPFALPTLLLVAVIAGYILGNRGFAQLSLSNRFPIFPAEAALALGGALLLIQSAWRHDLPLRRDPLNLALLGWIVLGTLRIGFDLRQFGFMALRDFALVYYAAFFYLGQELARTANNRAFLHRVLTWSCVLLLPLFVLFEQFPGFFLGTLTWRGTPLIFYKGDLAVTFIAIGAILLFQRFEAGGSRWNAALSLVLAGAVLAMNNRASLLGLLVATAWLAVRGRWRFGVMQAAAGLLAAVAILIGASALRISWERTPVFSVYERVVSIADPMGQRAYRGGETFNKGDNNLFRAVWWQAVIDETISGNPYVGLGFGHDLAERFVREYYPESGEEFTTRSPHNVLLTIFGRMGAAGLAVFLLVCGIIARETWRALPGPADTAGLWCAVWVMLTSACLGVVLEGPMGAVVFWTVLGVAHGSSQRTGDTPALEPTASEASVSPSATPGASA